MAYKRLLQLSRTTKVPITHPDFSDAYDDIWDGILRAYGLGMDETLKHIKELYPEGDVRPPMVGQTIDLEGEEPSD